jgi:hypothetical protein
MLNCRCVADGQYCDEAFEWVATMARWGHCQTRDLSLARQNAYCDARRNWNFHMHDANEARAALGLPPLKLGRNGEGVE